ncbi:MAG: acyl-CoA thioesterase [Flavobacteriales bacterium]|nr:acyl-CoA thioesterase [Flavobacteriales bacterium]
MQSLYTPEIRFADLDTMGHVNNAVYLSYCEQARIQFFRELINGKWDWKEHGILVARNEMNYARPIHLNDKLVIKTWCSHIGTKSFTLSYEFKVGEDVCSTGASVLVSFNHNTQKSDVIPELWRNKLTDALSQ